MSGNQLLCGIYQLGKMIGQGSYGKVYEGESISNPIKKLAIKIDNHENSYQYLQNQYRVYSILISLEMKSIPNIYDYRTLGMQNILVMERLNKNLQQILSDFHYNLPLDKGLEIGYQMLTIIEQLHKCQIIHRDIKPQNFLFGTGQNSQKLYLIDFGLAKKFTKNGKHIPYKQGKHLVGTTRFASSNNHFGIEQSRRDDIQSLAYVLVYLLKGKLPWQNIKGIEKRNKQLKIMQKKMQVSCSELTSGLPEQITSFVSYAKSLNFDQSPDYVYMSSLLRKARNNKVGYDNSKKQTYYIQPFRTIDTSSIRKSLHSYDLRTRHQSSELRKRVGKNESTNKIIKQIRSNKKLISSQPNRNQKKSLLFESSKMMKIQPIATSKKDIFKTITTQKIIRPRWQLARS